MAVHFKTTTGGVNVELMLTEAMESFLEYLKRVGEDQLKEKDLLDFERFLLKEYNRSVRVKEIQASDLEKYVVHLRNTKVTDDAINRVLVNVCALILFALKHSVFMKAQKHKEPKINFLATKELDQIVMSAENLTQQAVLGMLCYSPIRVNELVKLTRRGLDLEAGTYSTRSYPSLPFDKRLIPILQKYINDSMEQFNLDDKIFDTSYYQINHWLKRAVSKLGWTKRSVSPHDLRRSYILNCVLHYQGDIEELSRQLGVNAKTYAQIYVKDNSNVKSHS